MAGRIETYVHSDSTTQNKGAVIVKVTSETDFAARTDEFKRFAHEVAKMAFGTLGHTRIFFAGSDVWAMMIAKFPDLETQRVSLERELRESVKVTDVALMRL